MSHAAEDEPAADGEAAVDIEDYIEGYADLSAASKVKAIKKLELDMDDDDDYNTAVSIYEWEEAQDTPSSRVLTFLDDVIPQEGEAAAEPEAEDEPEADEDAEDAGDGDGEEGGWEEPWAKYDKQTAVDVKKHLDKLLAKEELSAEMAQYVIDYESQREKPPTRKRIVDYATKLMGELEGGEPEADEEPEEEAPARAGRPSRASRSRTSLRGTVTSSKEKEPEPAASNGSIFLVTAEGAENTTAYGIFGAMGAVADLLADGYESVTVEAG